MRFLIVPLLALALACGQASPTPAPTITPEPPPTVTPTPLPATATPYPTATPRPTYTPYPTWTPVPLPTPTPTPLPPAAIQIACPDGFVTETFANFGEETLLHFSDVCPEALILPTAIPTPVAEPTPEATVAPTATPLPTATPVPTSTPLPTATPRPTNTPAPTPTPSVHHWELHPNARIISCRRTGIEIFLPIIPDAAAQLHWRIKDSASVVANSGVIHYRKDTAKSHILRFGWGFTGPGNYSVEISWRHDFPSGKTFPCPSAID